MKKDRSSPRRRFLLGALAAGLALPLSTGLAQTYEYNYAAAGGTDYWWTDSARWGLTSPAYPSGVDVVAKLLRPGANATMRVDNLSLTLGELRFEGGAGTPRWSSMNGTAGNTATITLSKSSGMGVIYNAGGTTTLGSSLTLLATGGVEFQGSTALLIAGGNTKIEGGIKHSSAGNVYIYRSSMIVDQAVELTAGFINLGTSNAIYNTFNNHFTLTGTTANFRGIYSNAAGTRLTLTGNITGTASLLLGADDAALNDETELRGTNSYTGDTRIATHVLFNGIHNFGKGKISFTIANRILTYAAGNTADLTTNSDNEVRSVDLVVNATINTGSNDVTYANAMTGAGRLTKTGNGKLTLNGANSFAGATITEGTVVAGHASALGLSTANLEIGANGRLEIQEGLNITVNELELGDGAMLAFHLGEVASQLLVTGDQIGDGTFTITIEPGVGLEAGTYTLVSIAGSVEAGASAFVLDPASLGYGSLEWDQANGELMFHAIPEPSTGVLALMGLAGALYGFRRRGKSCAGQ